MTEDSCAPAQRAHANRIVQILCQTLERLRQPQRQQIEPEVQFRDGRGPVLVLRI